MIPPFSRVPYMMITWRRWKRAAFASLFGPSMPAWPLRPDSPRFPPLPYLPPFAKPMELEQSVELTNKYGLHARASTKLAQVAKQFQSSIRLSRAAVEAAEEEVDAKSILGLLTLGVEKGQQLRIRTSGVDADHAMAAVVRVIQDKFGEE